MSFPTKAAVVRSLRDRSKSPASTLSRKCACGNHTGKGGQCSACARQSLSPGRGSKNVSEKLSEAPRLVERDEEPTTVEPDDMRQLYATNGTTTCSFPAGTASVSVTSTACSAPCTRRHENLHGTDIGPCCTAAGTAHRAASSAADKQAVENSFFAWMGANRAWFECRAYAVSVTCADEMMAAKNCASSPSAADRACCATLAAYRADKETRRASNCASAASNLTACPYS